MTWIKICGMTNLEDALVAVDAGADAVGFVFYEKSPRNIEVETARSIAEKLPEEVEKVGVFVNETSETVEAIASEVGLTAVQFHGDEYEELANHLTNRKVFLTLPAAAVSFTGAEKGEAWGRFMGFPTNLGAIVLDSGTREERGGTGRSFNWRETNAFVTLMGKLHSIVIAGGLTPTNVGEAIGILKPWGVDVVSGVEATPGKKDPQKVRAFVQAVRDIDRQAS